MIFQLTHKLPRHCLVAVSGGVDSMVVLHWLSRIAGRVQGVVHFNHNTGVFADDCEELVRRTADRMGLDFYYRRNDRDPVEGASLENHWREQRYRFFKEVSSTVGNLPIVLAHQMDDCLEEYIMCTMVRGFSGTIPYRHGPCIRPFRLWKRVDIEDYGRRHPITWLHDPTNDDYTRFKRAFIRRLVVPRIKNMNPGVYGIVEDVIRDQDGKEEYRGVAQSVRAGVS